MFWLKPLPGHSTSSLCFGSYPDIEGLFHEQAAELDPKRPEAILHKLQQLVALAFRRRWPRRLTRRAPRRPQRRAQSRARSARHAA